MEKSLKLIAVLLIICLCLGGCKKQTEEDSGASATVEESNAISAEEELSTPEISTERPLAQSEFFTDRDYRTDYDDGDAVHINLNGDSASCNSADVEIDGTTVTVKNKGCYVLSGTLDDGIIIVDAEDSDKPQLVLDNVSISHSTGAPIYIRSADKVFITLGENSENSLANGGTFTQIDDNNIDSVIFSKSDLTLNGGGKLTITSPAGHGVVSKDDLVFTGGEYTVNCTSHGFSANNSIRISGIIANITAGKDGIHAEHDEDTSKGFVHIADGAFTVKADYDGVSASGYIQIVEGSFNLTCGGGSANGTSANAGGFGGMGGYQSNTTTTESMKGIKATGELAINGGSFIIDSADDAIHSNTAVTVKGGSFDISTGDDGFHADENLKINAGTINITESYEGLEALNVAVTGGDITLIARDDGINAAGGTDSSGMGGNFGNDNFGRPGGRPGGRPSGMGGGMMSAGNGSVVISGGNISIKASADGIDANGYLEITGGNTVVCGPTRGDTATLDYDTSATISGGTFIGTGASGGMAQTFSQSPQAVLSVNVGNQSAGTKVTLTDKNGKELVSHTPDLDFAVVIISSPEMVKGESYTISVGNKISTVTVE